MRTCLQVLLLLFCTRTKWYSLFFFFMWSRWRFQESLAAGDLAVEWPSPDHCCGWTGRPWRIESLHGWMGCSRTKFSSWQPLLNKHGTVCLKAQKNTFTWRSPLIPVSLFVIFALTSIYQINSCFLRIPLLPFCSPSHFCGVFPSVHLSIS